MDYNNFFNRHPVFTLEELRLVNQNQRPASVYNNLKYYMKKGRVRIIKPGLYYVLPAGRNAEKYHTDSIHLASRLRKDSVLAFHTALDIMGYGHSLFHKFYYYSKMRMRKFFFNEDEFICIKVPESLRKKKMEMFGVEEIAYKNLPVQCTNRERTFIDCLNRPEYCGGIEELYRCIEKYPYVSFDEIIKYLDRFEKKVLYAKVGFFLQQHRDQFYVDDNILNDLKKHITSSIVYFDHNRRSGKLIKEWNLVVPEIIIDRGWEEF